MNNGIIEKEKCCGCYSCMNICPKKAISMKKDSYGFKYPIINKSKCINCGLCKKVCPIIKNQPEKVVNIESYACYNKDETERKESSSGGIFILLAKEIIKRKGVVFGVSFDKDFKVIHSFTERKEDLKKFMGSKYVQSEINETYKQVKDFLLDDRYVLFTGTPCQIEGLKAYLQKEYDKLYTQDIICHGVPSPLVWEKYKKYRKKMDKSSPKEISFRNKDNGWNLFNMKFTYDNKSYKKDKTKDLFMQAFLRNTILRDSCYNCQFKKKYRISDITLADYWGITNFHKEMDDDKGVSLVLLNSRKGIELFECIKKRIFLEKTDFENAISNNLALIESVKPDKNRNIFFENLDKINFYLLIKRYTYRKKITHKFVEKFKKVFLKK